MLPRSEEIRSRIAADFLVIPPEWHAQVERIRHELAALLSEIAAAPEWKTTMDEIARESMASIAAQLDERVPGDQ
jgi:hypothetical protein